MQYVLILFSNVNLGHGEHSTFLIMFRDLEGRENHLLSDWHVRTPKGFESQNICGEITQTMSVAVGRF